MSVMTLLLDRLIQKIYKGLLSSCSSLFSVTLTVSMCVPCRLPLLQSCTVWTWRANTACLRTRTAKWLWFRSAALSVQWTESRWRSRRSSTRVRRHKPHQPLLFSCVTVKVSLIIVVFRVVCSVFTSCRLCCGPGAVILLGRTNMFRFNHPKEAAKLREKRKVRLYLLRAESETMFPPSSQQLYLYFHCQKFWWD